jgi:hypothetical protein
MPQSEWPVVKRQRIADFVTPDGYLRSERNLAGPLRMGTARGTGPTGFAPGGGSSDFGVDRITPKRFDVIGSHNDRAPPRPSSTLLSRAVRSRGIPGKE